MTISLESPHHSFTGRGDGDDALRLWVAPLEPDDRSARRVDRLRLDLAPPPDLVARRDSGELSHVAFIGAYEHALDMLPDVAFLDPLMVALERRLILVTGDRLSGLVLCRYLKDWAARSPDMEERMDRAARQAIARWSFDDGVREAGPAYVAQRWNRLAAVRGAQRARRGGRSAADGCSLIDGTRS